MNRADIIKLILAERDRQDATWGEQNHHPKDWSLILTEETGEVARALCEIYLQGGEGHLHSYLEEVVQVAAVCVNMLESFYRGKWGGK